MSQQGTDRTKVVCQREKSSGTMRNGLKHTSSSIRSGCKQMCENSLRPALENTSYFHSQKLINHFPPLENKALFSVFTFSVLSETLYITDHSDYLFKPLSIFHFKPASSFSSELYLLCVAPFFILSICTSSLFSQTFCFKNDLRGQLQPKSCLH